MLEKTAGDFLEAVPTSPGYLMDPHVLTQALHDMGSPLSTLRVLLELLRLTGGSPQTREELIEMLNCQVTDLAERLGALMKDVGAADQGSSGSLNPLGNRSATTRPGRSDRLAWQDGR